MNIRWFIKNMLINEYFHWEFHWKIQWNSTINPFFWVKWIYPLDFKEDTEFTK